MPKQERHPFSCVRCDTRSRSDFFIFPATAVWLIFYPDEHLAHLHFGRSTWSFEESTEQAAWIHEHFLRVLKRRTNERGWFVAVDVSRADDSTFPSNEAKEFYKKILQQPMIDRAVFYGASMGLTLLIRMILQFSHAMDKAHIVHSGDDVEKDFAKWAASHSEMAVHPTR